MNKHKYYYIHLSGIPCFKGENMKQYEYQVFCPNCRKTSTIVESGIKDKLFPVRCPHCNYVFTRIESYKKILPI